MSNFEILNSPEFKIFVNKTFAGDESSYRFFDMMPIGLSITTDISCKEIRHNPKAASFLRIDNWSILSHSALNVTYLKLLRDGRELLPEEMPIQRATWLGEEIKSEELEFVWNDGVRKFGLWSARPIRDENGVIVGALAVCEDITARRLLEEEKLKATQNRYLKYLENMLECFAVFLVECDEKGQIVEFRSEYINESGCRDRNITKEEHIGRSMHELYPNSVESGLFKMCCCVVETGEPIELDSFYISNVKEPNTIEVYEGRIIKLDNERITLSGRNITEKKILENEIGRLDRLNIVGEMAASIGHEIRNPLTTVRGYLQMFGMKEKYAEHKEQFNTMIEELDRANLIITEFLSLAKNKVVDFQRANLNEIINTLLPLLQAEALHRGNELRIELGDIPELELDKKEMRQLLMNLVRNAEEALLSNGTIVIKTGLDEGNVFLSVQDSGHGISKDILDKLGTPFLTTKDNGTGLGLPVCYRIAERHKAKIKVKTGVNGTTFFVKFNNPATRE
ncbi:ATP-binding protein [Sporomusa sp. KB1]|jgi:nitrogen-specific signal transduction histidine kinase|uniref:ATP-binding protein n=1 Tax=Sporomusa sp. KB1 TaxID=943346 RepID=UPI0011A0B988|nr:ATP-binding protein [Sporomusa sp. KB1]TWH51564.1 PAS domain S-box-containing protein [Sporomusa sp. KB1]TWH52142.1 PAS domain S-box-containing protein [Sporomusa sp. KB1]